MGSHNHQRTWLTEPFMFVSAEETMSNTEALESPHHPHDSMKRDVPKTLLHTRSYFGKRQKKSHPEPEATVESAYPSIAPIIAPRDYMSRSWSNLDSPHPLVATPLPSPALEDAGHLMEHTQKALQVGELVNRLNFKLRRLFGSRRGSAEDGEIPLTSSNRRCSMTSLNLNGPPEDPSLESNPEYLMWNGSCQLPNVSEFFDANGELGPSSFYHTADWSAFQKSFQTQGSLVATQPRLNNNNNHPGSHHGDVNQDRFDLFRGPGMQESEYDARKRKDSLFGFEFLRSRRSSKVEKGKGRMVEEDDVVMVQQQKEEEEAAAAATLSAPGKASLGVTISSLAELGVLPRVSMETMPNLSPTQPEDIPQAEFCSLDSSTPSWHRDSASSTPPDGEIAQGRISAAKQVALCHIVPAVDAVVAATARISPASSSVSSFHDDWVAAKTDSATTIPSASLSTPYPVQQQIDNNLATPATPCILPTMVISPPAFTSLSSSQPPLSSSSLVPMQTLNLGPPQRTVNAACCQE